MNNPSVHKAVLIHEVISALNVEKTKPVYFDGTLGGCGHALAIAEKYKNALTIVGCDMDPTAIERAVHLLADKAEKVVLENTNFRNIDKVLGKNGIAGVDLYLVDLGLSSDELENSGRGFSFLKDEPLYMTFGSPEQHLFTARDVLNGWKEEDIANVIFAYGEDRFAKRIAKKIIEYREKKPIETTFELAEIVFAAMPIFVRRNKPKINPATKTFQALRIVVNDELGALKEGLEKGYASLNEGGVMAVISFHSLEDRIVKEFFRAKSNAKEAVVSKKPIVAVPQEVAENPRSRSAKLRVLTKFNQNKT